MKRIIAQTRKELTQFSRDRLTVVLALVLPVVLMWLIGSSVSLTVSDLPVVVQPSALEIRSIASDLSLRVQCQRTFWSISSKLPRVVSQAALCSGLIRSLPTEAPVSQPHYGSTTWMQS